MVFLLKHWISTVTEPLIWNWQMCHGELQDNSSWFLWLALFNQRGRTNEIPWWHLWTYLRRARPERNQSALITVWLITMPAGYELCPTQTDVKASREPGNAITLLPHQLHVWWETICSGLSLELFGLKVQQDTIFSFFWLMKQALVGWSHFTN